MKNTVKTLAIIVLSTLCFNNASACATCGELIIRISFLSGDHEYNSNLEDLPLEERAGTRYINTVDGTKYEFLRTSVDSVKLQMQITAKDGRWVAFKAILNEEIGADCGVIITKHKESTLPSSEWRSKIRSDVKKHQELTNHNYVAFRGGQVCSNEDIDWGIPFNTSTSTQIFEYQKGTSWQYKVLVAIVMLILVLAMWQFKGR